MGKGVYPLHRPPYPPFGVYGYTIFFRPNEFQYEWYENDSFRGLQIHAQMTDGWIGIFHLGFWAEKNEIPNCTFHNLKRKNIFLEIWESLFFVISCPSFPLPIARDVKIISFCFEDCKNAKKYIHHNIIIFNFLRRKNKKF